MADIPEYSALSEAIVKLTGEGMGKTVNNPQSDLVEVETNQFNFQKHVVTPTFYPTK